MMPARSVDRPDGKSGGLRRGDAAGDAVAAAFPGCSRDGGTGESGAAPRFQRAGTDMTTRQGRCARGGEALSPGVKALRAGEMATARAFINAASGRPRFLG